MDNKYTVPCMAGKSSEKLIRVDVPGSKSITNRALLIAAFSNGKCQLNHCLRSDDTNYLISCLESLGFEISCEGENADIVNVTGLGGAVPCNNAEIYVGSAGTAARFLVAMLAFVRGEYVVNSSEQMKKRPMKPLIDALRSLGAEITCLENEGFFPIKIKGIDNIENIPDSIEINIDKSSQFLSALMIAAVTFKKDFTINIVGSHGLLYVDMTASIMGKFGAKVEKHDNCGHISYVIRKSDGYAAENYDVEPDMSAASYFYALGAILGQTITVNGVCKKMLQGDVQFIDVLEKLGATVYEEDGAIILQGNVSGVLKGSQTFDLSTFSDQTLTLSAIAPYADGPVSITGVDHIRFQECDRINAVITNLSALGIKAEYRNNILTVYPGKPHGGVIDTFDDHRVSMSFALTGLRTKGVIIDNYKCCKKTFNNYFDVLEKVLKELK
ncbi:MAG: 3-phosphoshikimate 1-carboxyvinyltransferase [Clostridiales bacterium]|nr:3-phosphoshikimate 1-carboxyvinyltransferase [Clostridiales bacterium]